MTKTSLACIEIITNNFIINILAFKSNYLSFTFTFIIQYLKFNILPCFC